MGYLERNKASILGQGSGDMHDRLRPVALLMRGSQTPAFNLQPQIALVTTQRIVLVTHGLIRCKQAVKYIDMPCFQRSLLDGLAFKH